MLTSISLAVVLSFIGATRVQASNHRTAFAATIVKRCPSAPAVSRIMRVSVEKADLGQGDCSYSPPDRELRISTSILHMHNSFPNLTTLAATKKHLRIGGSTAKSATLHKDGGTITSTWQDAPKYGPGAFQATQLVVGHGIIWQTCDIFVLDTDGYPASVQASAQRGGPSSYKGSVTQATVCRWAARALALAA